MLLGQTAVCPVSTSFPSPPASDSPHVTGGSYDLLTNQLTLTFSRNVQAASVTASSITMVGDVSGTRTNNSSGSFTSTTSRTFTTTGAGVGSNSYLLVSAPAGIPNIVDVANGNPVDPFSNLRIDLT